MNGPFQYLHKTMKTKGLHTCKRTEAFTLIEILCVVVIIAILAALVIGMGKYAKARAFRARAHAQIMQINGVIVDYKVRNGSLPPGLSNVVSVLPAGFAYSNGLPLDPWNCQYRYTVAGDAYRVFSTGPDMMTGNDTNSADDIEFNR